jgi:hypothetical protein
MVLVTMVAVSSCEQVSNDKKPETAPSKPEDLSLPIDTVALTDMLMSREPSVPLSGDLRPIWKVEGRIYNNDEYRTVSGLTIRISMNYKDTTIVVDTEDIDLKTVIPPKGTRAFARRVQLLPPSKGAAFEWTYDVISVERQP